MGEDPVSDEAKQDQEAVVIIPTDLWPEFRMWLYQRGRALEAVGEDPAVSRECYWIVGGERRSEPGVRNVGPWI
jgi:hypothetical protein